MRYLILSLFVTFIFSSCTQSESIIGVWQKHTDLKEMEKGSNIYEYLTKVALIDITFEFKADSTLVCIASTNPEPEVFKWSRNGDQITIYGDNIDPEIYMLTNGILNYRLSPEKIDMLRTYGKATDLEGLRIYLTRKKTAD